MILKKLKRKNIFFVLILLGISLVLFADIIFYNKMFTHGDYLSPLAVKIGIEKYITKFSGEYPYWLPSMMFGFPSVHSFQNISSYYPPQYIIEILKYCGMPVFWNYIFHILFGGIGMYLLMRYLKVGYFPSVLSSVVFIFNPYIIAMIMTGHGSQFMTAVYIPWVFYCYFKFVDFPSYRSLGLFSLILSFQLLRGHVQIAYYTWMSLVILILLKLVFIYFSKNKIKTKELFWTLIAFAIGLSASLSIYIPSLFYKSKSIRDSYDFASATGWSFSFDEAITLILPYYYGFGGSGYFGPMGITDFPNYIGPIVFIFAIASLFISSSKYRFSFFSISIFFFLLSLGKNSIIYEIFFSYFPFFDSFRAPMMMLIIVHFSIAVLFGLGLNSFIFSIRQTTKRVFILYQFRLIGLISLSLVSIVLFKGLISFDEYVDDIINTKVSMDIDRINKYAQDTGQDPMTVKEIYFSNLKDQYLSKDKNIKSAYSNLYIDIIYSIIAISLLFIGTFIIRYNQYIYIATLSILLVFGLLRVDSRILSKDSMDDQSYKYKYIDPTDKVIDYLLDDQSDYRVLQLLPWGNRMSAFMIEDVNGYHAAKLRNYNNFINNVQNNGLSPGILDMMNVKYILSYENAENLLGYGNVNRSGFKSSIESRYIYIYKNDNLLQRAFFVSRIRGVVNGDEQKLILTDSQFEPTSDSFIDSYLEEKLYNKSDGKLVSISRTPNSISIKIDCASEQFLIVSDTFYNDGWSASLNGKDIDILKVNGVFRGFHIPPGIDQLLEMKFIPNDILYGNVISLLAMMFIFMLLFFNGYIFKRFGPLEW